MMTIIYLSIEQTPTLRVPGKMKRTVEHEHQQQNKRLRRNGGTLGQVVDLTEEPDSPFVCRLQHSGDAQQQPPGLLGTAVAVKAEPGLGSKNSQIAGHDAPDDVHHASQQEVTVAAAAAAAATQSGQLQQLAAAGTWPAAGGSQGMAATAALLPAASLGPLQPALTAPTGRFGAGQGTVAAGAQQQADACQHDAVSAAGALLKSHGSRFLQCLQQFDSLPYARGKRFTRLNPIDPDDQEIDPADVPPSASSGPSGPPAQHTGSFEAGWGASVAVRMQQQAGTCQGAAPSAPGFLDEARCAEALYSLGQFDRIMDCMQKGMKAPGRRITRLNSINADDKQQLPADAVPSNRQLDTAAPADQARSSGAGAGSSRHAAGYVSTAQGGLGEPVPAEAGPAALAGCAGSGVTSTAPVQQAAGTRAGSALLAASAGSAQSTPAQGAAAEPHTKTVAGDAAGTGSAQTHLAPAAGSGPGAFTLAQLDLLLQQTLEDAQAARQHLIPFRCCAKLLYGRHVSAVQLAAVLPNLHTLLQHLQERVAGTVQGKSALQPSTAAEHAACVLRVLCLPEVQAVLEDQQLMQQLRETVRAAQREFDSMCASLPAQATGCVKQEANADAAAISSGAAPAAAIPPAAAAEDGPAEPTGRHAVPDQQGPTLERHSTGSAAHSSDVGGAMPHAEAQAQQRGTLQQVPPPGSAQHQPEPTQQPLMQQQQPQAAHGVKLKIKFKPHGSKAAPALREASAKPAQPSAEHVQQHAPAGAAAARHDTADGLAHQRQGETVQQASAAAQQPAMATEAPQPAEYTLAKLEQQVPGRYTDKGNFLRPARQLARLLHSPKYDSQVIQVVDLLQQWPVLQQYLQQRLAGTHPTEDTISASTAHGYFTFMLEYLNMQGVQRVLSGEQLQCLRQQLTAAKAGLPIRKRKACTSAGKASPGKPMGQDAVAACPAASRETAEGKRQHVDQEGAPDAGVQAAPAAAEHAATAVPPAAAAMSAQISQLTLAQLQQHLEEQSPGSSVTLAPPKRFKPFKCLAQLLHGSSYNASTVRVADLLQRCDVLVVYLQQRVAGRHVTEPSMAPATAQLYLRHMLDLLEDPVLQAQVTRPAMQQMQEQLTKAKKVYDRMLQVNAEQRSKTDAGGAAAASAVGPAAGARKAQKSVSRGSAPAAAPVQDAAALTAAARQVMAAVAASPPAAAAAPAASKTASMPKAAGGITPSVTAAGPAAGTAAAAGLAAVLTSERDLITAQRQLLWLYTHRLSPSLSSKLSFRSTMQMLAGLPPDDIRLDRFWADYDWMQVLHEDPDSKAEHWLDAFNTLLDNASRAPAAPRGAEAGAGTL